MVKPMMILISANVRLMESLAPHVFDLGHIPMLDEWIALPLAHLAGSNCPGDEAFNNVFHPAAECLLEKYDAVLRVDGESAGADWMVEVAHQKGLQIFTKLEQIPPIAGRD